MQWYLFPEKTTGWCPDFFQTQVLFFDPIDMEGLWSKKRSAGTLISMYGSTMHFQILRSITCCYITLCRVVVDMGGDSHWLRLHICFFSNRAHGYAHWNLFRSTLLALPHMFHPARDNCLQMKGMTAKHNVTPEIIYNHLCTLGLLSFHRCCSKPKKRLKWRPHKIWNNFVVSWSRLCFQIAFFDSTKV